MATAMATAAAVCGGGPRRLPPAVRHSAVASGRQHRMRGLSRGVQGPSAPKPGRAAPSRGLRRAAAAARGRCVVQASNSGWSLSDTPKAPAAKENGAGVFWLLVVNFSLFALDKFTPMTWVQSLYLNSAYPQWWQFITCIFCHYDWSHLSNNAFSLFVFGRFVEEEEGAFGVWAAYLITGIGGAIASHFFSGGYGFSLGASGAVFGLFAVSVLLKLQFNLRKLLEMFILGQFVIQQVMNEVKNQAALSSKGLAGLLGNSGVSISHVAHLGGAMVGVLLVFLLSRVPEPKQ